MWSAIGGLAGRVAKGIKHAVGIREKSMIHLQHGLEQFEQETGSLTSDFISTKVNKIKEYFNKINKSIISNSIFYKNISFQFSLKLSNFCCYDFSIFLN